MPMELLKTIRAAVFDVDGTLLDSMPMWHDIDFVYAARKGFAVTPEMIRALDGTHLPDCAKYFQEKCGVTDTAEEIIAEILELAREAYAREVPEIPGAGSFLRSLKDRGVPAAVATASDVSTLWPAMERLGMDALIGTTLCCDDVGKGKNFPDIYLQCAGTLGAAPAECAVFEDALYAAKTAKTAGFITVGVLTGELSEQEKQEFAEVCDLCISDYRDLL